MLTRLEAGETAARDRLFEIVYGDLKRIAAYHAARERGGHTLQPTALVHEACLRLLAGMEEGTVHARDRRHFLALASQAMRRLLVDYARARNAEKRGSGEVEPMPENLPAPVTLAHPPEHIVAVDRALDRLAAFSPRQGHVVEMRFFGGLTEEEIAGVLDVNVRTVKRDWAVARAWLQSELRAEGASLSAS